MEVINRKYVSPLSSTLGPWARGAWQLSCPVFCGGKVMKKCYN